MGLFRRNKSESKKIDRQEVETQQQKREMQRRLALLQVELDVLRRASE